MRTPRMSTARWMVAVAATAVLFSMGLWVERAIAIQRLTSRVESARRLYDVGRLLGVEYVARSESLMRLPMSSGVTARRLEAAEAHYRCAWHVYETESDLLNGGRGACADFAEAQILLKRAASVLAGELRRWSGSLPPT